LATNHEREASAVPNWEAALLEQSLSRRVHAAGPAYWGAGAAAAPPPIPPIALTGGVPDPESLPFDDLAEAARVVLEREGRPALQYGGPQGFLGLREWLAERVGQADGLSLGPENLTITNGSAGALANICETFLDPGDVVMVEAPSYPGAMRTIRAQGARVEGVPVDAEGLRPEALAETVEALSRRGARPKLLYTIPNFHNPTGATLSLERRRAVLEIARRHRLLIVEDDAYGEIRFEGERVPSFFALSGGDGVLRVGTFSKTLATGLRVGWVAAAQEAADFLVRMRFDMGTSPWIQRLVAEYVSRGLLDRHLPQVLDIYRRKRDAMVAALAEHCAPYASWRLPSGGFFLWLEMDRRVQPSAIGGLREAAVEEGVAYVSGDTFFVNRSGNQFIRLAYSFVAEQEIEEAIRRLGRALKRAEMGPQPGAPQSGPVG
jgi:2-aminoadipate transaminase